MSSNPPGLTKLLIVAFGILFTVILLVMAVAQSIGKRKK